MSLYDEQAKTILPKIRPCPVKVQNRAGFLVIGAHTEQHRAGISCPIANANWATPEWRLISLNKKHISFRPARFARETLTG